MTGRAVKEDAGAEKVSRSDDGEAGPVLPSPMEGIDTARSNPADGEATSLSVTADLLLGPNLQPVRLTATERVNQLKQAKRMRAGRKIVDESEDTIGEDLSITQSDPTASDDSRTDGVLSGTMPRKRRKLGPSVTPAPSLSSPPAEDMAIEAPSSPASGRLSAVSSWSDAPLLSMDLSTVDQPSSSKTSRMLNHDDGGTRRLSKRLGHHSSCSSSDEDEGPDLQDSGYGVSNKIHNDIEDSDRDFDFSGDDLDDRISSPTIIDRSLSSSRRFFDMDTDTSDEDESTTPDFHELHPEIETMWQEFRRASGHPRPRAPQPRQLVTPLLDFQLQGLGWMMKREKTSMGAGILADDMGMGKTIQACSLIMSDFPSKQPTLVVAPLGILQQWKAEIEKHTATPLMKILIYHPRVHRACYKLTSDQLRGYHVILVSYQTLGAKISPPRSSAGKRYYAARTTSQLHNIEYHRVIMDEAHNVKSTHSASHKACKALKATYRWCLTGTPVQNNMEDLWGLLHVLNLDPLTAHLCKKCSCRTTHFEVDEQNLCQLCHHAAYAHVRLQNRIIHAGDRAQNEKLRLVLDNLMCRRLKQDHEQSLRLPSKTVVIRQGSFNQPEQDFYDHFTIQSQRQFSTYVSQNAVLQNVVGILALLSKLRQITNHPDLQLSGADKECDKIIVCRICFDSASDPIRAQCNHDFCRRCAIHYLNNSHGDTTCPACRGKLTVDLEQEALDLSEGMIVNETIINRIPLDGWASSTKIEMLVYDLYKLRSPCQSQKAIIFSCFASMLHLVQLRLQKSGFATILIDGKMDLVKRDEAIRCFQESPAYEVLLMSTKLGVGLDLTAANRIFILDPWWNPTPESQAADRCYRIGQKRPVVVTKYCIADSIEERVFQLQERKSELVAGLLNGNTDALTNLAEQDYEFLFNGS